MLPLLADSPGRAVATPWTTENVICFEKGDAEGDVPTLGSSCALLQTLDGVGTGRQRPVGAVPLSFP